jgi:hypothetical protein
MQPVYVQALFLTLALALTLFGLIRLLLRRRAGAADRADLSGGTRGKPRRLAVYLLRLTGFALLAILMLVGGVMAYIGYQSILDDTAPAPSRVEIPPDLPFEVSSVSFTGGDGLRLAGWYVPTQNGATIILLHGYGGNRTGMLWHAGVLAQAGYGLLMYDERASGESDGEHRSYGWEDPADVGGALEYLSGLPKVEYDRIGIAGCSIGGQIALQGQPTIHTSRLSGPMGHPV